MKAVGRGRGSTLRIIKIMIVMIMPSVAKKFGLGFLDRESTLFFRDVIRKTLDHRRQTGERRNDMIDHFLDAMNNAEKNTQDMNDALAKEGQFEKDSVMSGEAKVRTHTEHGVHAQYMHILEQYVQYVCVFGKKSLIIKSLEIAVY